MPLHWKMGEPSQETSFPIPCGLSIVEQILKNFPGHLWIGLAM